MKLFDVIHALDHSSEIRFRLPDGSLIPSHFHITEVGQLNKNFIDCGGTVRNESTINFQLFTADDYDHRMGVDKMKKIIKLSIAKLDLGNHDIEVEFQSETINKYGLDFVDGVFQLTTKQTDCLAKDKCGIPVQKPRIRLSTLQLTSQESCDPKTGCC
ncbi:MAG: DUF6428 family protein [Bacteroidota bacterium]